MGIFDVNDLTNKIDVGSQPGTMWSLSSQKPGHGLGELRDPNFDKLWQSDGLLPHLINIQFARRTALTHVSLYTDFKEDDSYTPHKVRILAGTHFHDLVEVRTRELLEPTGWKHFILDNFEDGNESDDGENDGSSDASDSSQSSTSSILQHRRKSGTHAELNTSKRPLDYLPCGVSKRHAPIHAFLVQICILSNHAAGKDTHIRGIRIFGPPTKASREKAKRDLRKLREANSEKGETTADIHAQHEQKRRKKTLDGMRRWALAEEVAVSHNPDASQNAEREDDEEFRIHTSRRLNLLSSIR
ncbi:galactose-binding like protein [Meira miltonrushii]|uniref:Galactose-binding like protein n=1 Tax=Meira miltonrushii TaxID=1280837 RepID=A0A316V8M1_9BASI|nr:galactose-binding like protein [Meira miltonrushii]PWN33822.1 galactose-binding like protein [Meira miltonrushii]